MRARSMYNAGSCALWAGAPSSLCRGIRARPNGSGSQKPRAIETMAAHLAAVGKATGQAKQRIEKCPPLGGIDILAPALRADRRALPAERHRSETPQERTQ